MKIAIMQPYFLPYIGYFQLIKSVDKFIIYDDVNYIKQGWINRNQILVQNKAFLFTIPLQNVSSYNKINEVKIDERLFVKWKKKFLRTIDLNYSKSPYFKEVFPIIKSIIEYPTDSISEYNLNGLKTLCNYLEIKSEIRSSSKIYNNQNLKKQERILDICKIEKATTYINPEGGIELYSKEEFNKNNINLKFLKSDEIIYEQSSPNFISHLSIIDIIMMNSKMDISKLLTKFKLI